MEHNIQNGLSVYVFNIGAGDHIMLEFPDKSLGIIDSFYQGNHLNLKEVPALTYLKYLRKNKDKDPIVIAFICISHADTDHLTGLEALFDFIQQEKNNVVVENLWLFGGMDLDEYIAQVMKMLEDPLASFSGPVQTELHIRIKKYKQRLERLRSFRNYWRAKNKNRTERYFDDRKEITKYGKLGEFEAYAIGPLARLVKDYSDATFRSMFKTLLERGQELSTPISTRKDRKYKSKVNRNTISSILFLKYKNYNLIFGGDATKKIWKTSLDDIKEACENMEKYQPDFLKASHHGAEGSSTLEIWNRLISPSKSNLFVGISAGDRFGHPTDKFYLDITKCCTRKGINPSILRTNECSNCKKHYEAGKQYDRRTIDWFDYGKQNNSQLQAEAALSNIALFSDTQDDEENLLAYVFQFPADGTNQDVIAFKGVSSKIGSYKSCVLNGKSKWYCPGANCINPVTAQ
jgi:hypothetical protein